MDNFERIRLVDKYSKMAEPIYSSLPEQQIIEILGKILNLKFSRHHLIATFMAGDPIVNKPGYRLEEFLKNELAG